MGEGGGGGGDSTACKASNVFAVKYATQTPFSLSDPLPPRQKKTMEGKGAETTNIHFIVYSAYSLQYCGEHSMGCRASFRKWLWICSQDDWNTRLPQITIAKYQARERHLSHLPVA